MADKLVLESCGRAGVENKQSQLTTVMANKHGHVLQGRAGTQSTQDKMRIHGDNEAFPLLDLPAELRIEIYRLVLGQGRIVVQITSGDEAKNHPHDAVPTRALTQVCRQIRKEALPVYLTENKFFIRSQFRRSPRFWSFVISNKYKGPQEVLCLKFWLEKRIPTENLCDLKQIEIPRGKGSVDGHGFETDVRQTVAENNFWGSLSSFGSLGYQLGWFAEFLCGGMDQLIPSSVLLQPMRELTADCIPAPLFDKWIAAYTYVAQAAKIDPATNLARREKDRYLWIKALAPEEQILMEEGLGTVKNLARRRQGSQ